jgi:hypothetical protein
MTEKIILGVIGLAVIAVAIAVAPDLRRYLKIRAM